METVFELNQGAQTLQQKNVSLDNAQPRDRSQNQTVACTFKHRCSQTATKAPEKTKRYGARKDIRAGQPKRQPNQSGPSRSEKETDWARRTQPSQSAIFLNTLRLRRRSLQTQRV